MTPLFRVFLCMLVVAALAVSPTGCASIQNQIANNADTSKLAVQLATMKVIESSGDAHDRAVTTRSIIAEAKTWLDTDSTTVDLLREKVSARVAKLDLQASDKLLVDLLVNAAIDELNTRIGAGLIPADKRVTVNEVLSWVDDAAKYY